ncbi:MAG TPA: DNA repair protein RecO [Saprospiraceae bacterium]|nr:DNA repair protein RecO [Saprospiraceae bacterium]
MIYQTRAIVLRTVKFGESSLIVDMYTEQKGHQTFIINSVRKAKAITPASFLQLLTLVDIVAYHQEHKKINRIKEVRLDHTYQSIPFDMRKSSVITCLADITSRCLVTAYPQPDLFSFLHAELVRFDVQEHYDRDFMIRLLVSLTHYLGFGLELPDGNMDGLYFDLMEGHVTDKRPLHNYVVDPKEILYLQTIIASGASQNADISLDIRRRIIDLIIIYYQLHVETLREVKSFKILRELF